MITLTREEFLNATGVDLLLELDDTDTDVESMAELTLKRWSTILYKEVLKNSLVGIPDDDKLSELQVTTIKDVLCNLGLYYKTHGDIKALGGSSSGLEVVPSDLMDDLRHCGLIRRSLGRRSVW